jgi:hypothetical protein
MDTKKQKNRWDSEKHRVLHVLETWKKWHKLNTPISDPEEYLQRIANIVGMET